MRLICGLSSVDRDSHMGLLLFGEHEGRSGILCREMGGSCGGIWWVDRHIPPIELVAPTYMLKPSLIFCLMHEASLFYDASFCDIPSSKVSHVVGTATSGMSS